MRWSVEERDGEGMTIIPGAKITLAAKPSGDGFPDEPRTSSNRASAVLAGLINVWHQQARNLRRRVHISAIMGSFRARTAFSVWECIFTALHTHTGKC